MWGGRIILANANVVVNKRTGWYIEWANTEVAVERP